MFEPNVLNYFLVLLGGFGAVWSYRLTAGKSKEQISEVEYAAFSTLWGIPVFFVFFEAIRSKSDLITSMFALPMAATPILFMLGCLGGYLGAKIISLTSVLGRYLETRGKKK